MFQPKIFLPRNYRSGLARVWILIVIAFIVLCVIIPKYQPELAGLRWVFGIGVLVWTLFFRQAVSITIFPEYSTLEYTYTNAWGGQRTVKVDLTTALGYYELEHTGKTPAGWRLVLYNGSYFNNRVSVKENSIRGFTKAQLDEIVTLVHACKR